MILLQVGTDNLYFVKVKNKVLLNDEVEIITPKEQFTTKIVEILDEKGERSGFSKILMLMYI